MSGTDILREVEESMRAEKAAKFWRQNSKTLIFLAVALIAGTAAQSAWISYKDNQSGIATSRFINALQSSKPLPELEKLSAEKKDSGSTLAGLGGGSMAISQKDWEKAIRFYEDVISNKSAPSTFKELAAIQLVALKLDHVPDSTSGDLLKLLAPVIAEKGSAWGSRALFMSALVKAGKDSDWTGAQTDLKKVLETPNLSPSFEEHVKFIKEVYRVREGQQGVKK